MKIYTLYEILKTEHIGDEKYVRYEEIERLKEEVEREKQFKSKILEQSLNKSEEIGRLKGVLRNIVDNVHSRIEMYNRAKQALKEKE